MSWHPCAEPTVRADLPGTAIARTPPFWLADLAGAWIFYTVLPAWPWPPPQFRRIARFAPWIGLLIGSLQAALWLVLTELGWSPIALAPLVLGFGIWLSGGLHHDGLMDTSDGLAAGVERRLIAMEDSRVGASGVLALVMVLFLEVAALIRLGSAAPIALLLAGFWARVAPLWAMARFDYLRPEGSAAFHRRYGRPWMDALPALLVLPLLAWLSDPLSALAGLPVALLCAERLGRRLGGHTGDSYGATLVLTEGLTLLVLSLMPAAVSA